MISISKLISNYLYRTKSIFTSISKSILQLMLISISILILKSTAPDKLCAGLRQVSQFFLGYVKRAAFWPGLREVSCFVACVTSSEPLFWLTWRNPRKMNHKQLFWRNPGLNRVHISKNLTPSTTLTAALKYCARWFMALPRRKFNGQSIQPIISCWKWNLKP